MSHRLQFLIDVNLPYYFSLWNSDAFQHQSDIDPSATDQAIWEYAKEHDLNIITKVSDFSNKILFQDPPPKVIHIKTGNCKLNEFFEKMNRVWPEIVQLNKDYKLVNVFDQRLEAIN